MRFLCLLALLLLPSVTLAQASSAAELGTGSDSKALVLVPSHDHSVLAAAGAGPDVIRLSIGLETADDLLHDLDQGLALAAK